MLKEREKEYVEAAMVQGESDLRVLFRQILPNCMAPVLVQATLDFAHAIIAEASLSFLGIGVPPPTPSWGSILHAARSTMEFYPWAAIFPGLAICFSVLGLNLLGDGLRDVLDPASERGEGRVPEALLDVRDLETRFFLRKGILTAVDRVSFQLAERQTLGIVGETGSGKSVLALSLMRLVPQPPGRITNGQVLFKGEDLLTKTEPEMRSYRGSRISMIFQEPMVALNPAYTGRRPGGGRLRDPRGPAEEGSLRPRRGYAQQGGNTQSKGTARQLPPTSSAAACASG